MLTTLEFADEVCCLVAKIEDLSEFERDPLEDACIPQAIARRRTEFHAGRSISRIAMSRMGFTPASIPVGENRQPCWPAGMIGSISHNRTYVGIAITGSSCYKSIGFDLEKHASVTPSMFKQILVTEELTDLEDRGLDPTFFFSSKEAVFKAVFPIHNEYFNFTDVLIKKTDSGYYARSCNQSLSFAQTIEQGSGIAKACENYMANLFLIPS